MDNLHNQLDVTKNIKMLEVLKCQILTGVADLHNNLSTSSSDSLERLEIFADLIILNYILANRLGFSPETVQVKINKKLRIGTLEVENSFSNDAKELLKFFNNR